MIRLTEDIMAELQKRNCGPLENFVFSIRLQMWPVFQKAMGEHIESVKRLAEGTSASLFRRGTPTTDLIVANVGCYVLQSAPMLMSVAQVCKRYIVFFNSFIALTDQAEETMIFSKYALFSLPASRTLTNVQSVASTPGVIEAHNTPHG